MIIPATFFEGGKVGHKGYLDITDFDEVVRRMVESVTQGAGEERSCETCKHKECEIDRCCLGCKEKHERWEPSPTPPVEDSLAKARKKRSECFKDGNEATDTQYIMAFNAYESAIRERDEAMSQMMTVEEFAEWLKDWLDLGVGTVHDFIRQKIKERNEGKKPFDPGRETGGTD